jgi:hypothetical protein
VKVLINKLPDSIKCGEFYFLRDCKLIKDRDSWSQLFACTIMVIILSIILKLEYKESVSYSTLYSTSVIHLDIQTTGEAKKKKDLQNSGFYMKFNL